MILIVEGFFFIKSSTCVTISMIEATLLTLPTLTSWHASSSTALITRCIANMVCIVGIISYWKVILVEAVLLTNVVSWSFTIIVSLTLALAMVTRILGTTSLSTTIIFIIPPSPYLHSILSEDLDTYQLKLPESPNCDTQLLCPHTRSPAQSESLEQSPSPSAHCLPPDFADKQQSSPDQMVHDKT